MCEPVTLGAIAGTVAGSAGAATGLSALSATTLALTAGAGVLSAASTYQQGQVAKQVAANNATMAEYAAQDAERRGEETVQKIQRDASRLSGAQRSMMAARGLDITSGTPAEILDQTDFFAQTDVNTARNNAAREAWSTRAEGRNALAQGRAAASNANLQSFSTLLGTAGSVANRWNIYSTPPSTRGP